MAASCIALASVGFSGPKAPSQRNRIEREDLVQMLARRIIDGTAKLTTYPAEDIREAMEYVHAATDIIPPECWK